MYRCSPSGPALPIPSWVANVPRKTALLYLPRAGCLLAPVRVPPPPAPRPPVPPVPPERVCLPRPVRPLHARTHSLRNTSIQQPEQAEIPEIPLVPEAVRHPTLNSSFRAGASAEPHPSTSESRGPDSLALAGGSLRSAHACLRSQPRPPTQSCRAVSQQQRSKSRTRPPRLVQAQPQGPGGGQRRQPQPAPSAPGAQGAGGPASAKPLSRPVLTCTPECPAIPAPLTGLGWEGTTDTPAPEYEAHTSTTKATIPSSLCPFTNPLLGSGDSRGSGVNSSWVQILPALNGGPASATFLQLPKPQLRPCDPERRAFALQSYREVPSKGRMCHFWQSTQRRA